MDMTGDSRMKMEDFITCLFEKGGIKAVGSLMKIPDSGNLAYTLITNPDNAKDCVPYFPAMPVNASRAISRLTRESSPSGTVAVFLRPCELRALVELVKLKQADLDNLLLISFDCGGVFAFQGLTSEEESKLDTYWKALREGANCPEIRPVCAGCGQFVPMGADVIISLVGRAAAKNLALSFPSEKGKQMAQKLALYSDKETQLSPQVQRLTEKRHEAREGLAKGVGDQLHNLDGLMEVFDRCISCHACSSVCPICYCKNCYFESRTFTYFPESYFHRMKQKGGLRLPMDRILFHLGRLSHMGTSCVACGMCEDVCPVGIPVAQIFKTAGEKIQAMFDYLPGQHLDQPLPLLTFQFEELQEAED